MIPSEKIRVLVVDDSMVARGMIIKGLSKHPRIEVVGHAINTVDAKRKIEALKPNVVTMDVEMPGQSGPEFLKQYIPTNPIPVVLVSSLNLKVFDALAAGAIDFVHKPGAGDNVEAFIHALTQKVLIAASSRVRPMVGGGGSMGTIAANNTPSHAPTESLGSSLTLDRAIIGLGASTGGTEATLAIMKQLPADIPGMVIVQHMPRGFTKMYAERLNRLCKMEVREATHEDEIRRGVAYVAPADLQCKVVRIGSRYFLSCQPGEKVSGHRPSVDVMFQSMADCVQTKMTGIILTGMGQDGANGLLAMRKKGAFTIGQDKESSVVYGMPMVAHDIGAVCTQASCPDIANVLLRHLKSIR